MPNASETIDVSLSPRRSRLDNIDVLRGLVMIIMALDHSRDFFSNSHAYFDPIDVTQTSVAFFLTRWVTDFCAPVFCFLAGVGASFSASRGKAKTTVAWLLFTRGLWLIFLELAIIRVAWYFNFDYTLLKAGVIWCLGWSMVALAGLIFLPRWLLISFSVTMLAGHNLLDGIKPSDFGSFSGLWTILHVKGSVQLFDGVRLLVVYPLIPWIGLMSAGYACGPIVKWDPDKRRKLLFISGLALTIGFVLLRWINVYGDLKPWTAQSSPLFTFLDFLACAKYPPSVSYLLMTMGPAFLLLALLDRPQTPGWLTPAKIFGRVPFLFYVLHLPLLHAMAVVWSTWKYGEAPWLFTNPPGATWPHDFQFDLLLTYSGWVVAVLILYPVCKWFADYKASHKNWWLSYL
ncbi:MAG: DUF1624 domain-containing protein [Solidesulfovibrio sp.]